MLYTEHHAHQTITMQTILCFYHSPCNDGGASAAALRYRILEHFGEDAPDLRFCPLSFTTEWNEELPVHYVENEVHPKYPVSTIYIVDISFSREKYHQIIAHLKEQNKLADDKPRVICIDHHKTALEKKDELDEFCDETYIKIGEGLSGATLVWNYFNETFDEKLPMPKLLQYVADQDIWEWKLPNSMEINTSLNTLDGHIDCMVEELAESMADEEKWMERRRSQGAAIMSMVESQINKSMRHVIEYEIDGVVLRMVNATDNSSELGNHLCEHSHHAPHVVAFIYSVQNDWSIKCSVRTIDGSKVTARQFAERFGGGGHDNAAGCRFNSFEEMRSALNELKEKGWDYLRG